MGLGNELRVAVQRLVQRLEEMEERLAKLESERWDVARDRVNALIERTDARMDALRRDVDRMMLPAGPVSVSKSNPRDMLREGLDRAKRNAYVSDGFAFDQLVHTVEEFQRKMGWR